MDFLEYLYNIIIGLLLVVGLVVLCYIIPWAVASGWARGRATTPRNEEDW